MVLECSCMVSWSNNYSVGPDEKWIVELVMVYSETGIIKNPI